MIKQLFTFSLLLVGIGMWSQAEAQANKNKKNKYYQNNPAEADFNVKGFYTEPSKNEVEEPVVEDNYDVKFDRKEGDTKYRNEKRVIKKVAKEETEEDTRPARTRRNSGYYTTYGGYRKYNEKREKYDKYYSGDTIIEIEAPVPVVVEPKPVKVKKVVHKEREIKMTEKESEYKTTVVKKRYTNLDVLCDDLDLAKIQRPVFKGICSECSHDVDLIITNKNMNSLEKNYNLKQCYMLRDKRLNETLDDDQYKKWLRIKDSDEYLVITKDLELKDGVNN